MNDIKFRFWDKKRKVMMYECIVSGFTVDLRHPFNIPPTTNLIPLEYTGLKDKNNVEIYEGDIVKINDRKYWKVIFCATEVGFWIKYIYVSGFWKMRSLADSRNKKIEVIGNIYENKNLTEQPK